MKRQVFAFATIGAALFAAAPGLAAAEEAGPALHEAPAAAAPSPEPVADPEQPAPPTDEENEPPRPDSGQSPTPPSPEPTEDPRQPEPSPEPSPEPNAEEAADAQGGGSEPAPIEPEPIEPAPADPADRPVVQDSEEAGFEAPGEDAGAPPSVPEEGRQDGPAGPSGESQPVNGAGAGAGEPGLARTGPDGLPWLALGGSGLLAAGASSAVLSSRRRARAEGLR